jgi:hypothetical protein
MRDRMMTIKTTLPIVTHYKRPLSSIQDRKCTRGAVVYLRDRIYVRADPKTTRRERKNVLLRPSCSAVLLTYAFFVDHRCMLILREYRVRTCTHSGTVKEQQQGRPLRPRTDSRPRERVTTSTADLRVSFVRSFCTHERNIYSYVYMYKYCSVALFRYLKRWISGGGTLVINVHTRGGAQDISAILPMQRARYTCLFVFFFSLLFFFDFLFLFYFFIFFPSSPP